MNMIALTYNQQQEIEKRDYTDQSVCIVVRQKTLKAISHLKPFFNNNKPKKFLNFDWLRRLVFQLNFEILT